MKAMILAAGRGERMGTLTQYTPKPLLPINGCSLIEYHLYKLAQVGITDIVINVAYRGSKIMAQLGDGSRYGVKIQYSQEAAPLGTGGGIYNALPLLGDEPFIVISSDIWSDYDYSHLTKPMDHLAHLLLVDNPPFHPRGDFALYQGKVSAHGLAKLNFSGIGVYHPHLFQTCQSGKYEVLPLLLDAMHIGQVTGEYYSGPWFNVGTPDVLQQLQRHLTINKVNYD